MIAVRYAPDVWTIVLLLLLPVAAMVTGFVLVVRHLRAGKEGHPGDSAEPARSRNRGKPDDPPD